MTLPKDVFDEAAEEAYHNQWLCDSSGRRPVHAKVTERGDVQCPHCGVHIVTPTGHNPHKGGVYEKRTLNDGIISHCHLCREPLILTRLQAWKHNYYWYPDDPEFQTYRGKGEFKSPGNWPCTKLPGNDQLADTASTMSKEGR